jgi:hypothetical protein
MMKRSHVWITGAGAATLLLATAAIGLTAATRSRAPISRTAHLAVLKKGDADRIKPGRNAETAIGANEKRGADSTPDIERYLQRAYPADEIPMEATIAAQNAWAALNAGAHSSGSWQLIGPSKATYPGVLNALGDGAQYVTAGRVTAMAIGPTCVHGACPVYVAAAGGGIWRAKDGLAGSPNWKFVSGSFATNAIGSLVVDPTDPSGQTLYAGTGEPNASADSEAGVGIYKSTDGGDTWAKLSAMTTVAASSYTGGAFDGRSISSIVVDPTNASTIYVGSTRGVRGISSVLSGGATTNPPPPAPPYGLYKSTDGGNNFSFIWDGGANGALCDSLGEQTSGPPCSIRGANHVEIDPYTPTTIYAAAFQLGVWRSTDGGATWTQIKTPLNATLNTDRAEFSITKSNGLTRMYVGVGNSSTSAANQARFYRTDDAAGAAVFSDLTTPQVRNYCTAQCWYDNVVYSPPGHPDAVYVGGSFDYGQLGGPSNARGLLLSTDAGATWSDLTQDGDPHHADATHPDQHGIVVNPNNPFQYWEGSDGGVVRSDGLFADVSYKCNSRGLSAANTDYCKSLLWRVPNQLYSMNEGFSTLQYQSLSASAKRPQNNLQGGTQDNGTFQYTGSSVVWYQEMYGDGGQSGFSPANEALRFNTFTGQYTDVNFRNGDPTKWVIATGPIVSSPEGSYFYPPVTGDPNPANWGTIFQGSNSVWRTQDWAGDRAYLEANCPEFTTSGANPACGDFVPIGPALATDLTDSNIYGPPVYGADRRGGFVAAIERAPGDTGTLWVATGTGRVFVSDNSDAAADSVTFTRIDSLPGATADPGRFVSSIYVDPANPHHAWISYSGYDFNTPAEPGHIFDVTYDSNAGTATWTSLDGTSYPDLPATDLVRDDVTGDLYAASDFGVMRLASGSTTWTVAGSGLPMVEVPGLTIAPSARLLYAATHGRSAWLLRLP